jgi:hypothetical protein
MTSRLAIGKLRPATARGLVMLGRSTVFLALGLAPFLLAPPAHAASCTGNCGSLGPDGVVTAPPIAGPTYSYISTRNGPDGAGQIDTAGGVNGSEYRTGIFSANAGDALDFAFNYVTSDGAEYSDYAFAELLTDSDVHVAWLFTARTTPSGDTSPGFELPSNDSTLTPGSTPIIPGGPDWSPLGDDSGSCYDEGCGYTGWIESTYSIGMTGNYILRFGVTNSLDHDYDSGLAFAGLTIAGDPIPTPTGVPEPASWAMMLGGFAALGGTMRMRRRTIRFA